MQQWICCIFGHNYYSCLCATVLLINKSIERWLLSLPFKYVHEKSKFFNEKVNRTENHGSDFVRYLGRCWKMYFILYAQRKQEQQLVMVALVLYFLVINQAKSHLKDLILWSHFCGLLCAGRPTWNINKIKVRKETQTTKDYLDKTTFFKKSQLLYQIRYKRVYSNRYERRPDCIHAHKEQGEHSES